MGEKKYAYGRKIVKQLYFSKLVSCADLSGKIEKSLPLTTKILNDLIEKGYVTETGYAASTGGRRPVMYSLKPDVMYTVAVAMDQYITRLVVVDMQNRYVTPVEKIELPLSGNRDALKILMDKIAEVANNVNINRNKIIGVGIGMPGFVDSSKGLNYTFLESVKGLDELIAERIKLPVFIDNDSSLTALAELKFGAARNKKNAMVINTGWGVGLGLILNGDLFRGQNGFAGEFSHIPLFTNNKLCSCGKSGCLETEASLKAVVEKAAEELKKGRLSILGDLLPAGHYEQASEAIVAAAGKGDKFCVELLSEAGYHIGRGVAILIHLLNPDVIILSGRGSSAGKIWQAPIQQALNEHCIPRLAANTSIKVSELGYQAELIGAAALVMENYEREGWSKCLQPNEEEYELITNQYN